jgi:TRAP-type uncharacterized transport system fused permease subunit
MISAALTFGAIVALSAMTIGWLVRPLSPWERIVVGLLGIGTVVPGHDISHLSAAALVIAVVLLALQRRHRVGKAML